MELEPLRRIWSGWLQDGLIWLSRSSNWSRSILLKKLTEPAGREAVLLAPNIISIKNQLIKDTWIEVLDICASAPNLVLPPFISGQRQLFFVLSFSLAGMAGEGLQNQLHSRWIGIVTSERISAPLAAFFHSVRLRVSSSLARASKISSSSTARSFPTQAATMALVALLTRNR